MSNPDDQNYKRQYDAARWQMQDQCDELARLRKRVEVLERVYDVAKEIGTAAMAPKDEWDEIRARTNTGGLPGEPLIYVRLSFVERLHAALEPLT